MAAPFWSGKNSKFLFFYDGQQVTLHVQNWSVKPNVTEAADGVCGEDRDRLQTMVNFYEISVTAWNTDLAPVEKLLANIDNNDANVQPKDKTAVLSIKPNDGTSAAFVASEISIGAWELSVGGRTERATLTVPMRARFFKPAPTL